MPYGIKRGVKAPGDYNVTDLLGFSLAGAAGIIAALITDYRQHGEASSLYTLNQWAVGLGEFLGAFLGLGHVHIPLWGVAMGLVAVGAGSIFYFQPITRQGAFAQGFGLLAVIMTAVPTDLASALSAPDDTFFEELGPAPIDEAAYINEDGITQATYRTGAGQSGEAQVTQVQARRTEKYSVYLEIIFEGGVPDNINRLIATGGLRGRLHNEDTGATYNLFRRTGGGFRTQGDSIFVNVGVPARSETATLYVRIECNGHSIEEQSAEATLGQRLNWKVNLKKTDTPMFLQRLGKSFWF